MAELVAAIGTSHAPPVFLAPEYWRRHSSITDTKNTELLSPRTGIVTSYEDLVQEVSESDPQLLSELTPEIFAAKYKRMRAAMKAQAAAQKATGQPSAPAPAGAAPAQPQ